MTIETYLLYLGALGVFFATPPDTSQLLIIANSACHGLKKSGWTIAGDLTANILQMTAAAFGIAAVIAASAEAFQIVKWLGVAYLAWIGLRLMISNSQGDDAEADGAGSPKPAACATPRPRSIKSLSGPVPISNAQRCNR